MGDHSTESTEYLDDNDEPANPLTLWSTNNGVAVGFPEYPIASWIGDTKGYGKTLLPYTTALYNQTKELDLGLSRVLMSTLKSARGVISLTKGEGASNKIPEVMDEGTVILENGLALNTHSTPSINQQIADDIIANLIAHTSEAWRVPAYKLAINGSTTVHSAAALIELNKPQLEMHQARAEMNRENVNRIFHIENGLASVENNSIQGQNVVENWEPKYMDLQLSEKERIENAVAKKAAGIADVYKMAEEILPQINSVDEAKAYIDELEKEAVAPATGLARFGK